MPTVANGLLNAVSPVVRDELCTAFVRTGTGEGVQTTAAVAGEASASAPLASTASTGNELTSWVVVAARRETCGSASL